MRKLTLAKLENHLFAAADILRGKTPPYSNDGIPVITAENVMDGEMRSASKYVTSKTYEKWTTRGFHEPRDVIITTEAPVGEIAQAPNHICLR